MTGQMAPKAKSTYDLARPRKIWVRKIGSWTRPVIWKSILLVPPLVLSIISYFRNQRAGDIVEIKQRDICLSPSTLSCLHSERVCASSTGGSRGIGRALDLKGSGRAAMLACEEITWFCPGCVARCYRSKEEGTTGWPLPSSKLTSQDVTPCWA